MADQEYFTVHHRLSVNIEPLAQDYPIPSLEDLEREIPVPFLVAGQFSQLDKLSERARHDLSHNNFNHLIALLDAQNEKLNLLLNYLLTAQDDPRFRHFTTEIGASQITYTAEQALEPGLPLRVKLFLDDPAAAIYCYAQVSDCEAIESAFSIRARYVCLREQDEDLLIKAALHQQQRLLRQRAIERNKT